jgi:predicted PurR-regulated permease PerM
MITSTVMWLRFAGIVLVIAVLYLGRAVLVPLAVAILLTFVRAPVVMVLQRYVGRIVAVVVVVVLTFSLLGAVVWTVVGQLQGLAHELPHYRDTIRQRIVDLRGASRGSAVEKVQETVKDIQETIAGKVEKPTVPTGKDTSAGLWDFSTETLVASGADAVGGTLLETRDQLDQLVPRLAGPRVTAVRAEASRAVRTAAP